MTSLKYYRHRCQLTHPLPGLQGCIAVALTDQGNSHNRNFALAVCCSEFPTSWYLHSSFLSYLQVLINVTFLNNIYKMVPPIYFLISTSHLIFTFLHSSFLLVYLSLKLLFNSPRRLFKALWAGHTIPIWCSSQIVSPISWFCQAIYIVWQLPFFSRGPWCPGSQLSVFPQY